MAQVRFAKAAVYAGGAAIIFLICSVVQAAGSSTMFSTSYAAPGSALLGLAMNVTFWPGWVVIAGLLVAASRSLLDID